MSNCYQRGAQGGPTGNLESFMVHKVGNDDRHVFVSVGLQGGMKIHLSPVS